MFADAKVLALSFTNDTPISLSKLLLSAKFNAFILNFFESSLNSLPNCFLVSSIFHPDFDLDINIECVIDTTALHLSILLHVKFRGAFESTMKIVVNPVATFPTWMNLDSSCGSRLLWFVERKRKTMLDSFKLVLASNYAFNVALHNRLEC